MFLDTLRRRLVSSRPFQFSSVKPSLPSPNTRSFHPYSFFNPTGPTPIPPKLSPSQYQDLQKQLFSHRSPDGKSVMRAYWLLFGLNTLVFGTWSYTAYTHDRPLQQKLLTHTLVSGASWNQGRWWTTLTSTFTHHNLFHYGLNMVALHTMCSIISYVPGVTGAHILSLALGAGVAGSVSFLLNQKRKLLDAGDKTAKARAYHTPAIGASGAVMGVAGVASCLMPTFPVSLMFIPIPIPLWVTTALFFVADTYMMDSQKSMVAHAGHLGGLAFGVVYYLTFLRKAPAGILKNIRAFVWRRR